MCVCVCVFVCVCVCVCDCNMNIINTDDATPYAYELNSISVGRKLETESATVFE